MKKRKNKICVSLLQKKRAKFEALYWTFFFRIALFLALKALWIGLVAALVNVFWTMMCFRNWGVSVFPLSKKLSRRLTPFWAIWKIYFRTEFFHTSSEYITSSLYLVFPRRKGGKDEFVEEEFLRRKRSGGKKEEN